MQHTARQPTSCTENLRTLAKLDSTFRITKDGKVERRPVRKSVSARIAEKKRPKRRYVRRIV